MSDKLNSLKTSNATTYRLTLEQISDDAEKIESNDKYIPVLFKYNSQIHICAIPVELREKFPKWSLWRLDGNS